LTTNLTNLTNTPIPQSSSSRRGAQRLVRDLLGAVGESRSRTARYASFRDD